MTVTFNEDKLGATGNDTDATPAIGKTAVSCPRCKNKFCDRIKRGTLIKAFFPWLAVKRYYCAKCSNRFYKRG